MGKFLKGINENASEFIEIHPNKQKFSIKSILAGCVGAFLHYLLLYDWDCMGRLLESTKTGCFPKDHMSRCFPMAVSAHFLLLYVCSLLRDWSERQHCPGSKISMLLGLTVAGWAFISVSLWIFTETRVKEGENQIHEDRKNGGAIRGKEISKTFGEKRRG